MDQKNMRIALFCTDQNSLWVIDEIIYGLYEVNKRTFEVKCVIDSWKLFRYGSFKPHGLIRWKNDYIVIIPLELHKKWVIYNKVTGQVEYKKVIEEKYQGTFIGIDEVTSQAYFCPVTKEDPIIIIDLEKFTCNQIIKILHTNTFDSDGRLSLKGICSEKYFLFPLRGKRNIICLGYGSGQIKFLETDITEGIAEIDFYSDELWVLPVKGKNIYKINESGEKIFSVELKMNHQNISASEFYGIIVQKNYVFLLPYHQSGIYVYDKSKKKIYIIAEENYILPDTFKTKNMKYWGYYIDNNKICFLPLKNKYLQVDLDTLSYEERNIYYPNKWDENREIFYCIWNHVTTFDECMMEMDKYSQKGLVKYICNKIHKEKKKAMNISFGENIWSTF